jgi:hypothetical protein
MESAGRMARGSKIGSVIYRLLPVDFREFWMYRSFVGEAVKLIKAGKTDEEAMLVLMERYAKEFMPGYAEEKEMKVVKPQGGLQERPEGRKIDMIPQNRMARSGFGYRLRKYPKNPCMPGTVAFLGQA